MPASARSFREPPPGNHMGGMSNQERLRAYDAAVNADSMTNYRGQKMDLDQQKAGFDQAQKQAEFEQRSEQAQESNALRDRQVSVSEATQRANEQAALTKADHTEKVANSATKIFQGIGDLDNTSPQFKTNLYQLLANNPDAANHPLVMDAVKHELDTYDRRADLQQKAGQVDPLKQAQAIRGQITSLQQQANEADKNITGIEALNPPWINTGGIFVDANGTRRFGIDKVDAGDSPVATLRAEAMYNQYKTALQNRGDLQAKITDKNAELDKWLSGTAPNSSVPTAPPGGSASQLFNTNTPVGPDVIPPQSQPPAPVINAGAAAAQATGAPPPVVTGVAQASVMPTTSVAQPDIHQLAYQALKNGAPMDAVQSRLQSLGGDPNKLQAIIQSNTQGPPAPAAPAAPVTAAQ